MPSKHIKHPLPFAEAYELLPREASLEIPGASRTSLDNNAGSPTRRRPRIPQHGRRNRSAREEVLGSTRSSFRLPKSFRLLHRLEISLELITQSTPSLLLAIMGSVMTGMVFEQVQSWQAFKRVKELFILVPILLNLKGCLEMNLASRLSTSVSTLFKSSSDLWANIGELDLRRTRRAMVVGNLALLQVQALLIGSVAGLLSFVLGYFTDPHRETWFESALMIVSAMLSASLSSVVLSSFMSSLILVSRRFQVNPDNIATPLASSLGDLTTLTILSFLTSNLVKVVRTYWATALLVFLSLILPCFIVLVWRNPYVSELLFEGLSATILSMVIESGSGVLFQRFVGQYDALPLIFPVTASLAGNVGCIYAARLSTSFHVKASDGNTLGPLPLRSRDNIIVMGTLFVISVPIHLAFMGFVSLLGTFKFGAFFLFTYLAMGALSIAAALTLAYGISKLCWRKGYNPDNFVMGLISAITDMVTTILLVLLFKISS